MQKWVVTFLPPPPTSVDPVYLWRPFQYHFMNEANDVEFLGENERWKLAKRFALDVMNETTENPQQWRFWKDVFSSSKWG